MFDAAVPTDTASSPDWNPSRFADTSPPAGDLPALAGESPALVGALPTAEQQRCEVLSDEITTLAGHLNAANYRFLKLLDEFDRHDGWAGDGIRSPAHWLNFKCGLGELVAREKVRVARALRSLPSIDAAFERGEISYSKVRAMTRAATPENEAQLLNIARHGTAAHMERLVRAYRRCRKHVESARGEAAAGGLTPGELAIRREERFYCFADDDETMVFGGRVAVEQGRLLLKALDAMVAEIDAEAAAGKTEADAAAPKTDADAAAVETANEPDRAGHVSAETNGSATGPTTDPTTGPATAENVSAETSGDGAVTVTVTPTPMRTGRATALVHIAEHYLATGGSGARPLTSSEAYQVFVHVNANDAGPDNRINGAHTCHADDRRCLAPHVVRQLACDASRRTVLENERGEVLNIGRRSRTVPRRIGHALRVRDGGCRFPGCGQSRWTDAHHIRHWADGGETSLENLVTLCRYHHRSLHRGEYGIERGKENGTLIFLDGTGSRMPSTVHPQFANERSATESVQRLRAEHADRGVEIDATTAVTAWGGERMDYSTAIEWLLHRDGVAI